MMVHAGGKEKRDGWQGVRFANRRAIQRERLATRQESRAGVCLVTPTLEAAPDPAIRGKDIVGPKLCPVKG